ncbi:hypothetical protein SELMODRAFT_404835 [Selaginella moellendorffii]|uniref:Uncharacterized protein n=1 Tax=Selaginella moellendorffii TaxID=88036 RepID=D8QXI4_SELML|nr:hypothetical protein SELMODRAFT_404835 [Selaginella moellendorffii]
MEVAIACSNIQGFQAWGKTIQCMLRAAAEELDFSGIESSCSLWFPPGITNWRGFYNFFEAQQWIQQGTGPRILYDASSSQDLIIPSTRQPKTTSNVVPITEGKSPAKESDSKEYVTARDASEDKFIDPEGDFGSTMKQVESSSSEDVHYVAPKLNNFDPDPKQGATLEAIVITLGECLDYGTSTTST